MLTNTAYPTAYSLPTAAKNTHSHRCRITRLNQQRPCLPFRSTFGQFFGRNSASCGSLRLRGICRTSVIEESIEMVNDTVSQANVNEAIVTHSDYALNVDFESKTIDGYVKVHAVAKKSDIEHVILDTRNLSILATHVFDSNGQRSDAKFTMGEDKGKVLGSALTVELPKGIKEGDKVLVGVRFKADESSSAIQWLAPSQTAGGKHPYLFTQCQAIHARSLVPCQDTPAAKMTYSAAVRVPEELTALMSAVGQDAPNEHNDFSDMPAPSYATKTFYFSQMVPIPSYLLALAVGDLASRELGPKSKVWSEPSMVDAGAYEFAETPQFLEAAESIVGEYVWGRYDLLLLPPSFPYGGMENPCLTFVTPTLLAGDRSLANVVAHEIAHSWTGNLVTSGTWEHFWLNEGFTVFLERKILGRMHGEKFLQFAASGGFVELKDAVNEFGKRHPHTRLVLDMSDGADPDDSYSRIAYEKGFHFLYYLQELVGGPAAFEPFLKTYIEAFKFKTVVSDQFKAFFVDYFKDNEAVKGIDWDTWFYSPGMPPVDNEYDMTLAQAPADLAKKWHTSDILGLGGKGPKDASADDIKDWTANQIEAFLVQLVEFRSMKPLHKSLTRKMASIYEFDTYKNSEIRSAWCKLCVDAEDESILDNAVSFLKEQGRMKFVRPLFRALAKSRMGRELAVKKFQEFRDGYHPICAKMVASDLKV